MTTGRLRNTKVLIHRDTAFNKQLAALVTRGGQAQRAAQIVKQILGDLALGMDPLSKFTKHGESRLKHAFKYDLPGAHRLVCVHHEDVLWLAFVGTHEEAERWLDANRGLGLTIQKDTFRVSLVQTLKASAPLPPQPVRMDVVDVASPLIGLLPASDRDKLGLPPIVWKHLRSLTRASDNDELKAVVNDALTPGDLQDTVLSVLHELRDRDVPTAVAHIECYVGLAVTASDDPGVLRQAIEAPVNRDHVVDLRELTRRELEYLLAQASFDDWMLFLHPDQRRVVHESFDRPTMLRGVSGSGKTCVIVHRACALLDRFATERVAIVTLNAALAKLIEALAAKLLSPEDRGRLEVLSVEEVGRRVIRAFDPTHPLLTIDRKSGETLDVAWDECLEKDDQQVRLLPIVESLHRTYRVDESRYLRDEFIWVRSAFSLDDPGRDAFVPHRRVYENPELAPRHGREIPFQKDWRRRVLEALERYEEYLRMGGFADPAAISLLAHRRLRELRAGAAPHLRYRAVLVDEVQDLATVELELVAALVDLAKPDAFFLTGDSKQQVFPKEHDLAKAGIREPVRRFFKKNYRNPRQILEAGVAILEKFGGAGVDKEDDLALQRPEYSTRESAKPLCVEATDEDQERAYVRSHVEAKRQLDQLPVGIVVCGIRADDELALQEEVDRYRAAGLPCELLRDSSCLSPGAVVVSALETVKGFEFSVVFTTRCVANVIPDPRQPENESWRDARRLYVAVTRARDEAVFTWTQHPSMFLEGVREQLRWTTAEDEFPELSRSR